jgi:hypothetical protein
MTELNEEQSLVIAREDLGTIRTLTHRGQKVRYHLPSEIGDRVTLRFRGHGKNDGRETGDLLLHITVDRGRDVHGALWLSEAQAKAGCKKRVVCGENCWQIKVPGGSKNGQVLRLKGYGQASDFGKKRSIPTRADALIAVRVFADQVRAIVPPVDAMIAEDLSLESWVYRRTDQILGMLKESPFSREAFTAVRAADLFNEMGWEAIAAALRWHLGLQNVDVRFESSSTLDKPGQCRTEVTTRPNMPSRPVKHSIYIHAKFLDDPFAVTAIMAHEFCHVLEARHFGVGRASQLAGSELMEMERTVDLLVFLFGLGEFQMRVARQRQMTFGYFNQGLFERMHTIWSRKQKEFKSKQQMKRVGS